MRLIALCSISALLLVACSDDTQPTKQDQKITPAVDLALREAQPPKVDGITPAVDGKLPASDGSSSGLSCGAATTDAQVCAKACPTGATQLACMVKCNDDGKAKGCASAKPLFDALTACITSTCIADCLMGPTPACETCTKDKCKSAYDTCYAHKC